MSWASRRRALYSFGTIFFLLAVFGIPLYIWFYEPANCADGKQNQGETAPDKGGPCVLLDERTLVPHAVLWARSFSVRDGTWSSTAYIENPNEAGGVMSVPYRFKLYDDRNILVAEREGATFIMPGSVTPVYEGGIDTGNRIVARTYFEFLAPLVWERVVDVTEVIEIRGKVLTDQSTMPRVSAMARNTSVADIRDTDFVAVVFDTSGNAIAASSTIIPLLRAGEEKEVVFSWPDAFFRTVGRIDVIAIHKPESVISRRSFF